MSAPAYNQDMTSSVLTPEAVSSIDERGNVVFHNAEGVIHNTDGAAIIWTDGTVEYRVNGKLHRKGAPALTMADGYQAFYCSDMLHNLAGPAVLHADGTVEFWEYGQQIFAAAKAA